MTPSRFLAYFKTGAARPLGFFTRRLRHQIVIPYLILATVMAAVGAYLLLSAANQSLQERFNRQLVDAAQGGADSLVQVETQQIAGLRAIAYTQGLSDALVRRDRSALQTLAAPQALNYGFDRVMLVAADGTPVLELPGTTKEQGGSKNEETVGAANSAAGTNPNTSSLIESALRPTGKLDKVSAVVDTPNGPVFFTAGPVRDGENIVGAVLVGADMSRLLKVVARDSLSDGVSFYSREGHPGSVLAGSSQTTASAALPANWYSELSANPDKVLFRTVEAGGERYVEAVSLVPGRGLGDGPPGIYGTMLHTRSLDAKLQETMWSLLPVFGMGLVLIVLLGRALAVWIDRPVRQLVSASNQVAHGNLDVRVATHRQDELGVLAVRFNDMVSGLKQLLFLKDLFGRFVSPEVSEKLLSGEIELGGEQRKVTVLFSDLREFTKLSEEHPAPVIVNILNEYFRAVVQAARKHGGIVNKFGGDSTLIVFGAPVAMADQADRALLTALEMRAALRDINEHRAQQGWEPLRQGIGINTGVVVAGQIGSEDRMEYTVIGDAVNVAARLQGMTKGLEKGDIVFSGSTLRALSDPNAWAIEDLGQVGVRGKLKAQRVFSLIGAWHSDTAPPVSENTERADQMPVRQQVVTPVR